VAAVQIEVVGGPDPGLLSASDLVALPLAIQAGTAGEDALSLGQPRKVRAVRTLPNDLRRQRRLRRAGDFQAAERRAYAVASLQIP